MQKTVLFSALAIGLASFAACNNSNSKTEQEGHDMSSMKKDTMAQTAGTDDKDIKSVAVAYTQVNAKAVGSINEIIEDYLQVKNALVNDKGREAASSAKAMTVALGKLDKSLLTAEQKSDFDKDMESIQEDAEHISKKGDDIAHQRSHFASLSEGVYNLVKAFGSNRPLYHDHCPMAKDSQGAMWISETKEVKNPYFGSAMLTCGSVEEVIKK